METKENAKLMRNWKGMVFISHDIFHRWRQTVEETVGPQEAKKLVNRFWEQVAKGSAQAYLGKNKDPHDVEGVVLSLARASEVMGETVRVEKDGAEVLLVHDACPWIDSFREYGAPGQCQAGCDRWFEATAETISPRLKVVTASCLAAGDNTCTRRFSLLS